MGFGLKILRQRGKQIEKNNLDGIKKQKRNGKKD